MFLGLLRKKSLEEILFKMLLRKKYFLSSDLRWMFLGLLRKKSLEEIFNEIWPLARNLSSEFKRILDGCFWGCFARNLWRKSCLRCCFARNIFYHRILDGCFWGCFARNLWRKSFLRYCFARNILGR